MNSSIVTYLLFIVCYFLTVYVFFQLVILMKKVYIYKSGLLKSPSKLLPIDLIIRGDIKSNNLRKIKKNLSWLEKTLAKRGVIDINTIYSAYIDCSGKVHYTKK